MTGNGIITTSLALSQAKNGGNSLTMQGYERVGNPLSCRLMKCLVKHRCPHSKGPGRYRNFERDTGSLITSHQPLITGHALLVVNRPLFVAHRSSLVTCRPSLVTSDSALGASHQPRVAGCHGRNRMDARRAV